MTPVDSTADGALPGAPSARGRLIVDAAALLLRAAAPERRHVTRAAAWLLLAACLEALGPLIGKWLIDRYLLPRDAQLGAIVGLLLGALVAGFAASWLRYGQLVRLAGVAMRSVQRVREEVYRHVLRLPMSFFDRAITGQLVSRVTNDTEAVKQLYTQVMFEVLYGATVLFGVIVAMLWLDWRLLAILLGGAGVLKTGSLDSYLGTSFPLRHGRTYRQRPVYRVHEGIIRIEKARPQ